MRVHACCRNFAYTPASKHSLLLEHSSHAVSSHTVSSSDTSTAIQYFNRKYNASISTAVIHRRNRDAFPNMHYLIWVLKLLAPSNDVQSGKDRRHGKNTKGGGG